MRISDVIHEYGPATVGVFITLEGMGLPLPGELVLLTAGALAAQGEFSIIVVALAAWIGTIAGGTGGYWIGRFGGVAFLRRYGRWFGLTEERERVAQEYFQRHGARTIIVARFIALLRMIAGIVAGSAEMSFGLFSVCNAIGGLLWAASFAAIGYFFGAHLQIVEHYLRRGSIALLVLAILAGVVVWMRTRSRSDPNPPRGA